MLEIVREAAGGEAVCVYLPRQRSRVSYRIVDRCSEATYLRLLERGWRRFGRVFFRPDCAACRECRSLRLEVERFRPNRSMRRNLRRNRDLAIHLRPASMTAAHLALYNRYHADMAVRKGWSEKAIAPLDYYRTFVDGRAEFGRELLYVAGNRLLGVALVDILAPERTRGAGAVSAVYCFYEPAERRRGLGVFSVLQQIELARARGIPHLYLGFLVEDNASMRYKAGYHPHTILRGRPELDEEPVWEPAERAEGSSGSGRFHDGHPPERGISAPPRPTRPIGLRTRSRR